MNDLEISSIDLKPLRVEISNMYTLSGAPSNQIDNLMVMVNLKNGIRGYGEVAPHPAGGGEDLHTSRQSLLQMGESIRGLTVDRYRAISHWMQERFPDQPAARCGLETAILDAFTRSLKIPLWAFLGGKLKNGFITSLSLPSLPAERTVVLAEQWISRGFTTLKLTVGHDLEEDIAIVKAINEQFSEARFIFDAEQGFTEEEAVLFITEIISMGCEVILYEQPVERENLDGMARLRRDVPVPLVADEAVRSIQDLKKVLNKQAADVVKLKIMKTGVMEAWDLAVTAAGMGLKLMMGGVTETRLAAGCSLSIAAGLGSVTYYDLAKPLLFKEDLFAGGYEYAGAEMRISEEAGLGIMPAGLH